MATITDDEVLKVLIAEKKAAMEKAALQPVKDTFEAAWESRLQQFDAAKSNERAGLLTLREYQRANGYDLTVKEIPAPAETKTVSDLSDLSHV